MERTFLAWNVENWITVLLMAALGYLVLALMAQIFGQWFSSGMSASTSTGS